MEFLVGCLNKNYNVSIKKMGDSFVAKIDDKEFIVDAIFIENDILSLIIDGKSYEVSMERNKDGAYNLYFYNDFFKINIEEANSYPRKKSGKEAAVVSKKIIAPMAGRILKIPVHKGELVNKGDVLAIIEAMKMQNEIKADFKGKIAEIFIKEGESVSPLQPLIRIE